jgi:hypothetical protein
MVTADETQSSFDEVLDQVMAADPDTFYRQARAFDDAVTVLHDAKAALQTQRRTLEETWSTQDPVRFDRLDQVTRHLELLMSRYRYPSYPQTLRRIGDLIRDSQRRLLSLKDDHGQHGDSAAARADRDKRARKILADLSTSYRQLGGSLREPPERTADGGLLPASFTRTESPDGMRHTTATPVAGGAAGTSACSAGTTGAKTHGRALAFGAVPTQAKLAGDSVEPSLPAPFARFAHYAARPVSPGHGRTEQSFSGFANMAEPDSRVAAPAFAPSGNGSSLARQKVSHATESTSRSTPSRSGDADPGQLRDLPVPVKLDSVPATGSSVPMVPVTTAGPATALSQEATAAQAVSAANPAAAPPATSTAPQVSLAGSAAQAAAPGSVTNPAPAPNATLARPLPPAPPPAAVATNASSVPLALSANANLGPSASAVGSVVRPGLTPTAVGSSAAVPASRGTEVWLRADASSWAPVGRTPGRLGRDGLDAHDPTWQDAGCVTEEGRQAR